MTAQLSFAPLTDADIDWAWAVYQSTTREHIEQAVGWNEEEQYGERLAGLRGGAFEAILDDAGHRVGLLEVTDDGSDLTIRHLEVAPSAQGRGIGTEAISIIISRAARSGKAVCLRVLHVNPRALALYQRLGFTVSDERAKSTEMRLVPNLADRRHTR